MHHVKEEQSKDKKTFSEAKGSLNSRQLKVLLLQLRFNMRKRHWNMKQKLVGQRKGEDLLIPLPCED